MHRRDFMLAAGAAALSPIGAAAATFPSASPSSSSRQLAGYTLAELRERYHNDLFERFLPFWERYGIDHEHGGFMCRLDHDGTSVDTNKHHWFQGRGVWVWSYLYNHLDKKERHLEVARRAREFLVKHAAGRDGWWAELWSRGGKIIKPFTGDTYGMLFGAEGFQEYAVASGDDKARHDAFSLFLRVFRDMDRPDFRYYGGPPGQRAQGQWFIALQVATQMLRRWDDPKIAAIADRCVDAVVNKHYNAEIGLNTEMRTYDFGLAPGEETKCLIGHTIEGMWIVMEEARRRKDAALYNLAAERLRRHFEVGWDSVYGGLVEWINVDQGCYEWPVERPAGTDLEFRFRGEYHYLKSMWALDEAMIALMNVYEQTRASWAADYFAKTYNYAEEKFCLKKHRYPLWLMFLDRKGSYQPHASRQENYHRPRQLMYNLLALDRMIAG